jgi:hypothetical protein
MSVKSKSRPRAAKKIVPATVAIVAALITACGGIVASVVQTYGERVPPGAAKTKPSPAPSSPQSVAHHERQSSRSYPLDSLGGVTIPETEEYRAISFSDYAGPSGVQMSIPAGQVVRVYCRIPGDPSTPASVGSGGWYKIRNSNGTIGYTAANCFYNDPRNGYGMEPNNLAFDPAVPIC